MSNFNTLFTGGGPNVPTGDLNAFNVQLTPFNFGGRNLVNPKLSSFQNLQGSVVPLLTQEEMMRQGFADNLRVQEPGMRERTLGRMVTPLPTALFDPLSPGSSKIIGATYKINASSDAYGKNLATEISGAFSNAPVHVKLGSFMSENFVVGSATRARMQYEKPDEPTAELADGLSFTFENGLRYGRGTPPGRMITIVGSAQLPYLMPALFEDDGASNIQLTNNVLVPYKNFFGDSNSVDMTNPTDVNTQALRNLHQPTSHSLFRARDGLTYKQLMDILMNTSEQGIAAWKVENIRGKYDYDETDMDNVGYNDDVFQREFEREWINPDGITATQLYYHVLYFIDSKAYTKVYMDNQSQALADFAAVVAGGKATSQRYAITENNFKQYTFAYERIRSKNMEDILLRLGVSPEYLQRFSGKDSIDGLPDIEFYMETDVVFDMEYSAPSTAEINRFLNLYVVNLQAPVTTSNHWRGPDYDLLRDAWYSTGVQNRYMSPVSQGARENLKYAQFDNAGILEDLNTLFNKQLTSLQDILRHGNADEVAAVTAEVETIQKAKAVKDAFRAHATANAEAEVATDDSITVADAIATSAEAVVAGVLDIEDERKFVDEYNDVLSELREVIQLRQKEAEKAFYQIKEDFNIAQYGSLKMDGTFDPVQDSVVSSAMVEATESTAVQMIRDNSLYSEQAIAREAVASAKGEFISRSYIPEFGGTLSGKDYMFPYKLKADYPIEITLNNGNILRTYEDVYNHYAQETIGSRACFLYSEPKGMIENDVIKIVLPLRTKDERVDRRKELLRYTKIYMEPVDIILETLESYMKVAFTKFTTGRIPYFGQIIGLGDGGSPIYVDASSTSYYFPTDSMLFFHLVYAMVYAEKNRRGNNLLISETGFPNWDDDDYAFLDVMHRIVNDSTYTTVSALTQNINTALDNGEARQFRVHKMDRVASDAYDLDSGAVRIAFGIRGEDGVTRMYNRDEMQVYLEQNPGGIFESVVHSVVALAENTIAIIPDVVTRTVDTYSKKVQELRDIESISDAGRFVAGSVETLYSNAIDQITAGGAIIVDSIGAGFGISDLNSNEIIDKVWDTTIKDVAPAIIERIGPTICDYLKVSIVRDTFNDSVFSGEQNTISAAVGPLISGIMGRSAEEREYYDTIYVADADTAAAHTNEEYDGIGSTGTVSQRTAIQLNSDTVVTPYVNPLAVPRSASITRIPTTDIVQTTVKDSMKQLSTYEAHNRPIHGGQPAGSAEQQFLDTDTENQHIVMDYNIPVPSQISDTVKAEDSSIIQLMPQVGTYSVAKLYDILKQHGINDAPGSPFESVPFPVEVPNALAFYNAPNFKRTDDPNDQYANTFLKLYGNPSINGVGTLYPDRSMGMFQQGAGTPAFVRNFEPYPGDGAYGYAVRNNYVQVPENLKRLGKVTMQITLRKWIASITNGSLAGMTLPTENITINGVTKRALRPDTTTFGTPYNNAVGITPFCLRYGCKNLGEVSQGRLNNISDCFYDAGAKTEAGTLIPPLVDGGVDLGLMRNPNFGCLQPTGDNNDGKPWSLQSQGVYKWNPSVHKTVDMSYDMIVRIIPAILRDGKLITPDNYSFANGKVPEDYPGANDLFRRTFPAADLDLYGEYFDDDSTAPRKAGTVDGTYLSFPVTLPTNFGTLPTDVPVWMVQQLAFKTSVNDMNSPFRDVFSGCEITGYIMDESIVEQTNDKQPLVDSLQISKTLPKYAQSKRIHNPDEAAEYVTPLRKVGNYNDEPVNMMGAFEYTDDEGRPTSLSNAVSSTKTVELAKANLFLNTDTWEGGNRMVNYYNDNLSDPLSVPSSYTVALVQRKDDGEFEKVPVPSAVMDGYATPVNIRVFENTETNSHCAYFKHLCPSAVARYNTGFGSSAVSIQGIHARRYDNHHEPIAAPLLGSDLFTFTENAMRDMPLQLKFMETSKDCGPNAIVRTGASTTAPVLTTLQEVTRNINVTVTRGDTSRDRALYHNIGLGVIETPYNAAINSFKSPIKHFDAKMSKVSFGSKLFRGGKIFAGYILVEPVASSVTSIDDVACSPSALYASSDIVNPVGGYSVANGTAGNSLIRAATLSTPVKSGYHSFEFTFHAPVYEMVDEDAFDARDFTYLTLTDNEEWYTELIFGVDGNDTGVTETPGEYLPTLSRPLALGTINRKGLAPGMVQKVVKTINTDENTNVPQYTTFVGCRHKVDTLLPTLGTSVSVRAVPAFYIPFEIHELQTPFVAK